MTKFSSILVTAIALSIGSASLSAQSYFDAVDWLQHPDAASSANLYTTNGGPLLADTGDGTSNWRYRNTGPGVPAWGGSAYQIRYSEGDVPGYQQISGLTPNQDYLVMIFGIYPQNTTNSPTPGARYGIDVSFDGESWNTVDNRGSTAIHWVDNSSEFGNSLPTVNAGDTRFWSWVPGMATADGDGNLKIYLQGPSILSDGTAPDRFVLDGFGLAVPEPSSFALLGLGSAALMIFRRRR
jgi:PEP-CTERM putative exosortase interaction domain